MVVVVSRSHCQCSLTPGMVPGPKQVICPRRGTDLRCRGAPRAPCSGGTPRLPAGVGASPVPAAAPRGEPWHSPAPPRGTPAPAGAVLRPRRVPLPLGSACPASAEGGSPSPHSPRTRDSPQQPERSLPSRIWGGVPTKLQSGRTLVLASRSKASLKAPVACHAISCWF